MLEVESPLNSTCAIMLVEILFNHDDDSPEYVVYIVPLFHFALIPISFVCE